MAEEALEQLKKLEDEAEQQLRDLEGTLKQALKQHVQAAAKLHARRQELVSGKAVPTAEELQGHVASGAGGGGGAAKGVPHFWLNALCNQDTLADEISERDKLALSYCTSVRAVYPAGGGPPTVEMSFASNPFFGNSTLRRCLGDEEAGVREVTTEVQWKDNAHKLTVKEVKKGGGGKKGGKKGGKGGGEQGAAAGGATRLKPCASFFRFFLPDTGGGGGGGKRHAVHDPVALHADDEEDDGEGEELAGGAAKSAKAERDELLMAALLEGVLPKAAELYMSGPLQALDVEDEEEGGYQVVHGAGGSPSDLPEPVQALLAALRHNQAQLDELAEELQRRRAEVRQRENKLRGELADKRRAVLFPGGAAGGRVERFWLRVLRSADAAALAISARDAAVLAALRDVRFALSPAGGGGGGGGGGGRELHGKLELEFGPNDYLQPSCSRLVKDYSFDLGAGGEPFLRASKVSSAPAWAAPERSPEQRRGRDGRQRPAGSFFALFRQGGGKLAFNLVGADKEVQAEANELETELLMELHSSLLLRPAGIYADAAAADGWLDGDSPAGDAAAWAAAAEEDEEDSGSEPGSGDEGDAAHRAAARRAKAKAGGFRVTKASVLVALVVLVLLAELFVFLDMTGLFRSG